MLDTLQRVAGVTALPLHQGFAQTAGIGVNLAAAPITDVLCGVSMTGTEKPMIREVAACETCLPSAVG